MAQLVSTSDGTLVDLDSLPHTFAWSGGNLVSDTVVAQNGHSYQQVLTYSAGVVATISLWSRVS